MEGHLLQRLSEKSLLARPEALGFLLRQAHPLAFLDAYLLARTSMGMFVDLEDLESFEGAVVPSPGPEPPSASPPRPAGRAAPATAASTLSRALGIKHPQVQPRLQPPSSPLPTSRTDPGPATVPAVAEAAPAPTALRSMPEGLPAQVPAADEQLETFADPETRGATGSPILRLRLRAAATFRPIAADYEARFSVRGDITGQSTCTGSLDDFVKTFQDRFRLLRKLLRERAEMRAAVPVATVLERPPSGEVKVIGMVAQLHTTKWGGTIVTIEDESGRLTVSVPKDVTEATIITDEVIGVIGRLDSRRERLVAKTIVRPEVPRTREPRRAEEPICVAFVSDIHVGSKTFLQREWTNFLRWLNGHVDNNREMAGSIRYLVMNGDVVDGIGVYPNQFSDLDQSDLYVQYEQLAAYVATLPDHIRVLLVPGNHDAVRLAEPQPQLPIEVRKLFGSNVTFVGNPSTISLNGVELLAYHGKSLDDWIPSIRGLSYEHPATAMKEMLSRRHLAPIWGSRTPLAPEAKDYLTIETVPDIFVTGHVHAANVENYRNILLVNSSTWQSQTSYQKMLNFVPEPGRVLVHNLQTGDNRQMRFVA